MSKVYKALKYGDEYPVKHARQHWAHWCHVHTNPDYHPHLCHVYHDLVSPVTLTYSSFNWGMNGIMDNSVRKEEAWWSTKKPFDSNWNPMRRSSNWLSKAALKYEQKKRENLIRGREFQCSGRGPFHSETCHLHLLIAWNFMHWLLLFIYHDAQRLLRHIKSIISTLYFFLFFQ